MELVKCKFKASKNVYSNRKTEGLQIMSSYKLHYLFFILMFDKSKDDKVNQSIVLGTEF